MVDGDYLLMITYKTYEPRVTPKAITRENPKYGLNNKTVVRREMQQLRAITWKKTRRKVTVCVMSANGCNVRNRRYKLFLFIMKISICDVKDKIDPSINIIFVRQTWEEMNKLTKAAPHINRKKHNRTHHSTARLSPSSSPFTSPFRLSNRAWKGLISGHRIY